ncbi:hypothetical protein GCM10027280_35740 [Micromonospora polyrhachis]|uniref:Glycosyltransferase like family 2 n=1 Tax=Micromonospora polyrhachis TaxID=1282883 RepID=A0A7W7SQ02_9ACTN|nr:glycosyltransferase [Micromonospora polyrhachis]MBB4958823.1 hypothetical protein [Micromonospora polyrhachis]
MSRSGGPTRLAAEYVLPLRWTDDGGLPDLTAYLHWLRHRVDVTVVDGSPSALFTRHAAQWGRLVRHLRPDPVAGDANGKVTGVTTGIARARHERVIIADDDIRYDDHALDAICRSLDAADLVRPQNYFRPLPWHARWDTGRILLNRACGGDFPGTFGLRRSLFQRMGGYAADVLFENLELIRTVRAHNGVEARPADLFVRRLPPATAHFLRQRVRQAYDDLAMPARMALFLGVLPAVAGSLAIRRTRPLLLVGAGIIGLAEYGRRRGGGSAVFPATGALLAPGWVLERAVCSWSALGLRLFRGGVWYAGGRFRRAAHSQRHLDRAAHRQRHLDWAGRSAR